MRKVGRLGNHHSFDQATAKGKRSRKRGGVLFLNSNYKTFWLFASRNSNDMNTTITTLNELNTSAYSEQQQATSLVNTILNKLSIQLTITIHYTTGILTTIRTQPTKQAQPI
jgi:hypothetical protein